MNGGYGVEWMDEGLPIPSFLKLKQHNTNKGFLIGYQVNGFFGTIKASKYLNDMIARFLITFKDLNPYRVSEPPRIDDLEAKYYQRIYKLQELQNLKSLQTKIKAATRADSFEDYAFWAIKLYCEDLIRAQGIISYQQLENWALSNFVKKEKSTIKAKCRSVFNWYEARDFNISTKKRYKKTDEEIYMTRRERAISNARAKADKAKKAVINTITGMFADEYKKKSGAWHYRKIAEACGVDYRVVAKYIKEFEQKKI